MGRLHPSETWSAVSLLNVADVVPGLIAVYNIRTGEYVYVNKTVKRLLGYTPEQFLSGGIEFAVSLMHPQDLKQIMAENNAALELANQLHPDSTDTEPIIQFEYRMRHASGRWVWLHTDGSVFNRGPDGKVEHVLNISIDITAAKAAERKLRHLNQRLVALNQTKDEFISVASHQLRTPATGVKMYTGMLLQGQAGELSPKQAALVQAAYESNERQIKIINDLLCVARLDAGKLPLTRTDCDIVELVGDLVKRQAADLALRRQRLNFDKAVKRLKVAVDKELLTMALENLIDNAGKYSPEGESVKVRLVHEAGVVRIDVSDNGAGIAKKDYKKLFQKFSRLEQADKGVMGGTGLGLYWAKKIIALHGGTIELDSRLNQGSTFSVLLPRA